MEIPHCVRASGRSREKKSNFAGFSGTNSRKKTADFEAGFAEERPISRELPEQISLESDWFCADLRKVFNATRCSYSIYSGFIPHYEIVLYK